MRWKLVILLILFGLLVTTKAKQNETVSVEDNGMENESSESEEETLGMLEKPVVDPDDADDKSDVSEERNEEDFINRPKLTADKVDESRRDPNLASQHIAVISSGFNNMKSFACPQVKSDLITGTSTADLSPEDITVIGALGDALGTGLGLFPQNDIEFRGAAFTIGGDANVDGLITIPSILREFNTPKLVGVSHGMGSRKDLPQDQLNIADRGATTSNMTEQAKEIVARLKDLKTVDLQREWVLVIMTIGTEEVCSKCKGPDHRALLDALKVLYKGIPKVFVVLLGPIHVSKSKDRFNANLLKSRCECSRNETDEFMLRLSAEWAESFAALQQYFDDPGVRRDTFGLLALPMLTITSRYPYSLFIKDTPLLNRRGHSYAAKWLWNRLIGGDKYNLSSAVLSTDAFFCPSIGCPYFRSSANAQTCQVLRKEDAEREGLKVDNTGRIKKPRRAPRHLYTAAITAVSIAFVMVVVVGTFFYQWSKKSRKGRFEFTPEAMEGTEHEPEDIKEMARTLLFDADDNT